MLCSFCVLSRLASILQMTKELVALLKLSSWCHVAVRPLDNSVYWKLFLYFSSKTYVVGTQKNRHDETVILSTQNIRLN